MSDYGLITDLWRCCRPKINYYGAYPSGFLLKARRLLGAPLHEPVLHVCGGRARDYSRPEFGIRKGVAQRGFGPHDRTLDLDPALQPDFLQDAREPLPLCPLEDNGQDRLEDLWPGVLIDRPYTEADAAHYAPGADALPPLNDLLRNAVMVTQIGRRVGVLDYLLPSPPANAELVALAGVTLGFNNRIRCYSVFERKA